MSARVIGIPAPPPTRVVTLEEAYDIALATDQSIQIAYQEIRKANLLKWTALAQRLGPNLSAGYGYSYERAHNRGGNDLTVASETGAQDLAFSQNFLDFSAFPAYRAGKLTAVAARYQHQFTVRQTLFGVTSAYYQILTQQGIVTADEKTVELASQQLDVANKRLNVGEVTPTDALNAQVTLESARVALIQARNTLLENRDTLGNILNFGGDSGFQVIVPRDYPNNIPDFEKLLAIGYRNREDLMVAQLVIDEDIANKGAIIGSYFPTVGVSARDTHSNAAGFYGPQSQVWDANINVSMPILTGGEREINLRTSGETITEDRLKRDQAAKVVESDIRTAWLNAQSLRESLASLRVQVAAARKSYDDERNQYQAGSAASVDVLTALVSLNTSENNLAVQVYAYQVALRNLEQTAGVFQQQRVQRVKVK